jgi:predicted nuclease of predicted toxin-antitoxin system
MWLLDKNVPIQLIGLLGELGIEAVTADAKNWGALKNGELVSAAVADGISCIVTRDRLFAESAAKAIRLHASLSIVLLTLTQARAPVFLEAFSAAWSSAPILTVPGSLVRWPRRLNR